MPPSEEVDSVRFESASELATVYEKDVSFIMYDISENCIYISMHNFKKNLEILYLKQVLNFYPFVKYVIELIINICYVKENFIAICTYGVYIRMGYN